MKKAMNPTVLAAHVARVMDPAFAPFTPAQVASITDGLGIAHYAKQLAEFAKGCQDKNPGSSGHKLRALAIVKRALKTAGVCDGDQK